MDIKSISLMQKLMNLIVPNNMDHTTGILANYLLLHYDELENLPLNQVTADCFVSPSSVRRFCRKLGFENYSDLVEARLRNPEHQQKISVANLNRGIYHPAVLRAEINENLFLCFRSVSNKQFRFLASSMVESSAVVLLCTRPYNFWLREFQNQMIAWGKPTYIWEEPASYRPFFHQFGDSVCTVVVSPLFYLPNAYISEMDFVQGKKALISHDVIMKDPMYPVFSKQYDQIVPLHFKNDEYEYMEIYGKYSIGYLFDSLLGEIIRQQVQQTENTDGMLPQTSFENVKKSGSS